MLDNSDVDSEDEQNNNFHENSNSILNLSSLSRPKKTQQPRYVSRSLPVTPRVNGNCPSTQNQTTPPNSRVISSSSFVNGIGGSSTPLLMAPHIALNFPSEGSMNSIGSVSPVTSQYVTCSSALNESQEKVLPNSIDYSSLPLQREECLRGPSRRYISRHSSEPCIHEVPHNRLAATGKCYSCPQRKTSSKHSRRRESGEHQSEEECVGRFETSIDTDTKNEDFETIEMQWKFIRTLIEELNGCRCQNNRMAVELHQSKMEIQMLKATLESLMESGIRPGFMTDMVGQIHAAQKIRDEAMMSRIKLANEERDAALSQTHSLLEKLGLSPRAPLDNLNFSVHSSKEQVNLPACLRLSEESMGLAAIEEELKYLRMELYNHDIFPSTPQKDGDAFRKLETQDQILDDMRTKLSESEVSRKQLRERCSKLERVFSCLRRKVNGLSSLENPPPHNNSPITPPPISFIDGSAVGNRVTITSSVQHHSEETNTDPAQPFPSASTADDSSSCLSEGKRPTTTGDRGNMLSSLDLISSPSPSGTMGKYGNNPRSTLSDHPTTSHLQPSSDSSVLSVQRSVGGSPQLQPFSLPRASATATLSSSLLTSKEEGEKALLPKGNSEECSDGRNSLTLAQSLPSRCDFSASSTSPLLTMGLGVKLMGPITEL